MQPAIVPAAQVAAPIRVSDAFTPTRPRTARTGLIGREQDVRAIVQRLTEDKAHVVLYSERGIGKTSLANSVIAQVRRAGIFVVRYQCEASSNFDTVMRGLARMLPATLLTAPARPGIFEGCEAALPASPIRPEDVVALLGRLRLDALVFVIDEVDRIADTATRTLLADTIKQLSDRGIPLLFMLIGVSDSLEQLLGEHPSIQRALVGMPLTLLSDSVIAAILEGGAKAAGLIFPPLLVQDVARMARGMPHVAHLLGLRTAQAAARRSSHDVTVRDFLSAIEQLLIETPSQVVRLFDDLTKSGRAAAMCQALTDIAACEQDKWGRIQITGAPTGDLLAGNRPMARPCYAALLDAGIVRPYNGNADTVILTHRGRSVAHHYALRQIADSHPPAGPPADRVDRHAPSPDPAADGVQAPATALRRTMGL